MKKFLFLPRLIGFTLVIGFVVIGCSKIGGSPSNVAKQFYAALANGDSKAIGELMTPDAAYLMTEYGQKARGMIAARGYITNTEETIDGNTAVVRTTFKDGSTDKLDLVKVDGKWKVTIIK